MKADIKIFFCLIIGYTFSGCNIEKTTLKNCWNNINFKEIEQKLLTLPVRRKIPIYQYNFSKAQNETFKKEYKEEGKREVFILFFDNNLKAVFKPDEPLYMNRSIRAYQFSNFMKFYFVPPTVIRTINGQQGSVQLFVEADSINKLSKYPKQIVIRDILKFFNLSRFYPAHFQKMLEREWWDKYNNIFNSWSISPYKKSDIYIFYFVSGIIDPSPRNILISKKCKLPVLIDNDNAYMTWNQFDDWPFIPLPRAYRQYGDTLFNPLPETNKNFSIRSVEDFETFPLDKIAFIKASDLSTSKKPPYGMGYSDFYNLKKFLKYTGEVSGIKNYIYFVKWKNNYWVKQKQKLYYFIYKNPPSVFSKKTLSQLEKLNEKVLRNLLLKKDKTRLLGWLYRRDVILKEALKLEKSKIKEGID